MYYRHADLFITNVFVKLKIKKVPHVANWSRYTVGTSLLSTVVVYAFILLFLVHKLHRVFLTAHCIKSLWNKKYVKVCRVLHDEWSIRRILKVLMHSHTQMFKHLCFKVLYLVKILPIFSTSCYREVHVNFAILNGMLCIIAFLVSPLNVRVSLLITM